MRHLVFQQQNGSATAVPVNDLSVVNVKTFMPAVFAEDGGMAPRLVEDQSVALNDIVSVSLADDAPPGATVAATAHPVEEITQAEADALEAQYETVPAPWETD